MSCYEDKINNLTNKSDSLLKTQAQAKHNIQDNHINLKSLQELFSSSYKLIIDDLTIIIDKISTTETNVVDEESPASKINSLNLNWVSHPSCEGNLVINNHTNQSSYWCVEGEQILDGAFLCKVEVEEFNGTGGCWNHNFGIIRENKINFSQSNYYNNCILIASNNWLAKKYSGSGAHVQLPGTNQAWTKGDILFVKRDFNNSIWFGVNDESNMYEAYQNEEGSFRICMGFSSSVGSDRFRLVYLNLLT